MKKFLFSSGTREAAASAGLLILRLGMGTLIAIHGLGKVKGWGEMAKTWKSPDFIPVSWMSPPVSLGALVFAELVCGILLVIGLLTRPAAATLAFAMAVAAFYAHATDPWMMGSGAAKEPALLYLIFALALLAAGAGRFSADAAIHKEKRRWGGR
jgi:putative oxidoreductase